MNQMNANFHNAFIYEGNVTIIILLFDDIESRMIKMYAQVKIDAPECNNNKSPQIQMKEYQISGQV